MTKINCQQIKRQGILKKKKIENGKNKWSPSKSRQHIRGYCWHFRLLPNDDDNDNDNDYVSAARAVVHDYGAWRAGLAGRATAS